MKPGWFSGASQRDLGDLGRAVESEGRSNRAEAAIDVELQVLQAEQALNIFLAERGKRHGRKEGEAHLSAVGVSAEHELNSGSGRMLKQFIGEIGCMAQEDDGLVCAGAKEFRNGEVKVGMALDGVVEAGKPDA